MNSESFTFTDFGLERIIHGRLCIYFLATNMAWLVYNNKYLGKL